MASADISEGMIEFRADRIENKQVHANRDGLEAAVRTIQQARIDIVH